ncbi:MAG TPA: protein phosphatase 2C domain-containing protein [Acetivibrio sp.]|nr:protein phosphatase 2C domain-containing protein [Acetivibrio sp.]HPT91614.1 protein phosphatase 2C domain-containing protein [Acetivibrio sp.]HQA57515.1 protein phosphatase 2C domain-containing protein [Acetivibrio sp.]
MIKVEADAYTHKGRVREKNEDNFFLDGIFIDENQSRDCVRYSISKSSKEYIFAVCDGMGGQKYGEKASYAAVKILKKLHEKIAEISDIKNIEIIIRYLKSYVLKANEYIYDMSVKKGCPIGTTFACLAISDNKAVALNLGDSRVYLIRNGEIKQLTTDHTEAERLVRLGALTRESALTHNSRHRLYRYLGISPSEGILEADFSDIIEIEKNDIFLICSDGLTDAIKEESLSEIARREMENSELCAYFVNEALNRDGSDNITSLLISIKDIER